MSACTRICIAKKCLAGKKKDDATGSRLAEEGVVGFATLRRAKDFWRPLREGFG